MLSVRTTFLRAVGANQREPAHCANSAVARSRVTANATTPSGAFSRPPRSSPTTTAPAHEGQRPESAVVSSVDPHRSHRTETAGSPLTGGGAVATYAATPFFVPAVTAMSVRDPQ